MAMRTTNFYNHVIANLVKYKYVHKPRVCVKIIQSINSSENQ